MINDYLSNLFSLDLCSTVSSFNRVPWKPGMLPSSGKGKHIV
jgi:hypothetical protein